MDKLTVQIQDMTFNSQDYAPQTLEGNVNYFVEDIADELRTIANFDFTAVNAASKRDDISERLNADVIDSEYLSKSYLTAAEAQILASAVATKVDGIASLTLNGEALASSLRDDGTPSDSFVAGTGSAQEGLEIYVFNCTYKTNTYLPPSGADNASDFLTLINDTLDTIGGLEYSSIISVSSCDENGNTRIFVGVSQAYYNSVKYLTSVQAVTLKTAIENALDSISSDMTYGTIQIRCAKHDNTQSNNY